jgi:Tfp pilus assembly protein PilX
VDLRPDQWGLLTVMTTRIVTNLRREDGWVVVTAVIVMALMMAIGLATYSTVDTQQAQSRVERERDSSFNLGESALYAEAFVLGRDWPTAAAQYPPSCTELTAAGARGCPTPSDLQGALDSPAIPDLSSGAEWTIRVRDNGSPATGTDYDASTDLQPNYDANGDGKLWVRADAVAKGRRRSIVGLMEREKLGEAVAQNVITAGHFHTSNSGNKVVVDTQGPSATGSQVVVRCTPGAGEPSAGSACIGYDGNKGQVSPDRVYSPPAIPAPGAAMEGTQLNRFRDEAKANGTYYNTCPPSLTGKVVFVESTSTLSCGGNDYKDDYNSAASPGVLIITNGTLELSGNQTIYYGFIYMLNRQGSTGDVFTVHANATLQGGVAVDGNGGVKTGSDKVNIIFDGQAFIQLETHGMAGLVQNSWRELTPGT